MKRASSGGPMAGTGLGASARRREDVRLVKGAGSFTDDMALPDQTHAFVLRSVHAHANIRRIDTTAALSSHGVLAVLTAADMDADGLKPIPHTPFSIHPAEIVLDDDPGHPVFLSPHTILARDRVRYVGEPVALIVAGSLEAAQDGAERVLVEYDPLPSVLSTLEATEPHAPRIWDGAVGNLCLRKTVGDARSVEEAFRAAAHRASIETSINRVTGVPMEPRAALACFDKETGRYWLHCGAGAAHRFKLDLAHVLDISADRVRITMNDVGGNYGTKGGFYPEMALVAWAARRVGRPVKWVCQRSDAFLSDYQGRDLFVRAELALDHDGRFLGLRGLVRSNVGAHTVSFATLQKCVEVMNGLYHIPFACFQTEAVVTNTMMTRPYRATGRPEAMLVIERLVDIAASQIGMDRLALRALNLVAPDELPYTNPFGMVYDNGLYQDALKDVLKLADWDGFEERREASRSRGLLRGVGVGVYVDTGTGVTRERAVIRVFPDGLTELSIGTVSNGQGHETSYAQLINEWLGAPLDRVKLAAVDTDKILFGGGSHSGRSMRLASILIQKACGRIVDCAKETVAAIHHTRPDDLVFHDGEISGQGLPSPLSLAEVARLREQVNSLPLHLRGPLEAECDEIVTEAAFPYGAHVCEVEIDPLTCGVRVERYAAVDDVGKAINPMIIHGQTHGGIAQGVGQALSESIIYERSGQLSSGSFMDYALPRADTLPSFATGISEVPASSHPLGVRPGGEGGTAGALAATMNAVVHALSPLGISHMDMPATPQAIFRAIRTARSSAAQAGCCVPPE